jgi:hypothetical protein
MSKTTPQLKVKNVIKRDKHSLHREFGCSRQECNICFHGMPWQMYLNVTRTKTGK